MTAGAWPCVCGRTFAKRFGRNVHGRTCPIERARSDAYVAFMETWPLMPHGLDGPELAAWRAERSAALDAAEHAAVSRALDAARHDDR